MADAPSDNGGHARGQTHRGIAGSTGDVGHGKIMRAALYLRVSRDSQTTENQRIVLTKLPEHRGFEIVRQYEDAGLSGGKGRDKRPAFDKMLKDAMRRRFDVLLVWSMDRLGRSVLHVAKAMAELDAADVALISE